MQGGIWQIEEAQTHLLELIDLAVSTGPQMIARDDQAMVTVVATVEWDRISDDKAALKTAGADHHKFDLRYAQMRSFLCG